MLAALRTKIRKNYQVRRPLAIVTCQVGAARDGSLQTCCNEPGEMFTLYGGPFMHCVGGTQDHGEGARSVKEDPAFGFYAGGQVNWGISQVMLRIGIQKIHMPLQPCPVGYFRSLDL